MKLFFLSKRRYMNHDVIADRYGRLYHLPREVSARGHDCYCTCLSYQNAPYLVEEHQSPSQNAGTFRWYAWPAGLLGTKIPAFLHNVSQLIATLRPDAIIGESDALHVIFARLVSRRTGIPYFIDLYDNFESFGLYRLPGIAQGYSAALRDARGVSTVSKALERHISAVYPHKPTQVLESTIAPDQFKPYPKAESRVFFNLPLDAILVGTAGSLSANRDTGTLYEAFKRLHATMPQTRLVLAGPTHGNPPPPHPGIVYLGELPHQQVPKLFSALDLAVICMNDDQFGRYAFPQKAYEIIACGTPVVAAKVGALEELFAANRTFLYRPGDVENLKKTITDHIADHPIHQFFPIPSWADQAKKLERFIFGNL
ncbi:MAG: glycosyltransferase [Desulfobulbus sp.]|nr:glycosyltransferase [Desulfobulbus sp.]